VIQDSDEDPEITSGLKKGRFNVTNYSNRYFNFHFDNSTYSVEYVGISFIHGLKPSSLKKVADIITFFH
jgi:hypothetical protein